MIHSRLNTTVQATLNLRDLARLPVLLPPAPERKAIAHILGTLDDRIEANRRMAATLEEMARALFRAWFVTFEPVRAKAEGRWRRGQTLPGLPASLYDAFPNRLVETEHGEIPEGWRWGTMADVLELAYGRALKATDRRSGPYPVYGSGGITGYHDEALVEGPTVIVGRKGSVGTLYWADESCFPIDTVFYVVPRSPLTFCFYLLATLGLDGMNTDAAVPGLNRNNVYRLDVQIPLGLMVSEFDRITRNVRARIRAVLQETQVLAVLRDTLLPKLVSGTIRVKDAEAFLKARGL